MGICDQIYVAEMINSRTFWPRRPSSAARLLSAHKFPFEDTMNMYVCILDRFLTRAACIFKEPAKGLSVICYSYYPPWNSFLICIRLSPDDVIHQRSRLGSKYDMFSSMHVHRLKITYY